MTDLRTRIAAALKKADETVFLTDPFAAPEPSYSELADAVIDVLIDLAGHGELLTAIDRMYREPRSAEKLGLTGDGE